MVDAKCALSSCTFAGGRCVVPVECFDKIKCCVVRVCLSWEGSQGIGKGSWAKGG